MRTTVEIEITRTVRVSVEFSGKHIPATLESPEEHPEAEVDTDGRLTDGGREWVTLTDAERAEAEAEAWAAVERG